jgi:archaellum biogenesis ATPase FlaH
MVSDIEDFWNVVGFNQGDLISIVGRTGSGKTTMSIILACLAYERYNKKILFIGSDDYQDRFDKYSRLYQENKIVRKDDDWVVIRVSNNDINFEEIKEYVREYDPDLIVIESYATYRGFEDMMDFATKLKSLVNIDRKTIIATTELSIVDEESLEGNYLSFVSDIVLFCSLQDNYVCSEVIKGRGKITNNIFESEY